MFLGKPASLVIRLRLAGSRRWAVVALCSEGETSGTHWPSFAAFDLGKKAGIAGCPQPGVLRMAGRTSREHLECGRRGWRLSIWFGLAGVYVWV
jgi:hypothetical protein